MAAREQRMADRFRDDLDDGAGCNRGVLRGASEASTLSVLTSAALVGHASVAAGTIVQVVAESIGHSLFAGGHLIAFLPNELGRALIHQSYHGVGWT